MEEEAIVLYPSPAIGHLISMVELGKLILKTRPSLSINILLTTPPHNVGSTAPYINHVSATVPSISFHRLPAVALSLDTPSPHPETLTFELLRLNNPHVYNSLSTISKSYKNGVCALIMDFFCFPALTVAADLRVPAYMFSTSGAGCLAFSFYFPTIHQNTTKNFKEMVGECIEIPGLPLIPATDFPTILHDRDDDSYTRYMDASVSYLKSDGIIVNTFDFLESRAVGSISDGLCVSNGPTPPIYYIGPLISSRDGTGGDECLAWLDSQMSRSVVFLCFGSLGNFSVKQLMEIAVGLERSGQGFLWVVRSPAPEDKTKRLLEPEEPDLDSLLPDGFLERTKDRGRVVKNWAPQKAVLNHESVGGFVTHCGWNSVLEAICAGVPMVAWPLYAEQRFNRVLLVSEMNLALPMEEEEEEGKPETDGGFVTAAEVERRVRELMDLEKGKSMRMQAVVMKEAAEAAMREGGSSHLALARLVESLRVDTDESI